jgi:hypothetical protein
MSLPSLARPLVARGALTAVAACGGSGWNDRLPALSGSSADMTSLRGDIVSTVYVASLGNARVLGFAIGANGNVAPTVNISGAKTLLTTPARSRSTRRARFTPRTMAQTKSRSSLRAPTAT